MLSISDEAKTLYKNYDAPKYYLIDFPAISLTIENDQIVSGSFALEESIFSDRDMAVGSCEASMIKFTVADVTQDLKGQEFTVVQSIGEYQVPLGTYIVDSCKKQDDMRYKDIIAFDRMKKIEIDVAPWYNLLTFPMTLAQFRSSFLAYVGLTEDTSKLPLTNDSMIITKTIEPSELPGRDVIEAIEEINGVFGHINREGLFAHIILAPMTGLYPSEDLLPAEDLYPVSESDGTFSAAPDETITENMRESIRFEEYSVKQIFKLQIRSDEADIGAIVGGDQKVVIDTKSGTSVSSAKAEKATTDITRIEGNYAQTVTVQGKNLFDKNKAVSGYYIDYGSGNLSTNVSYFASGYISIDPSTAYICNGMAGGQLAFYDVNKVYISGLLDVNSFTSPSMAYYIRISDSLQNINLYQLELGSTATAYTPFIPNSPSPAYPAPITVPNNFTMTASDGTQSNSATVAQELRKLPNGAMDTIEKATDTRLKRRVGKVVFDGSADENWITENPMTNTLLFYISGYGKVSDGTVLCDRFPSAIDNYSVDIQSVWNKYSLIEIRINKAHLASQDLNGFRAWLSTHPVTVYYELATPTETIIPDITLNTYEGSTSITTNASPQVNFTADFIANTDNTYIITGNFLCFGKSAADLEIIATNASAYIFNRPYRPYVSNQIGLPYVEVGDLLKYDNADTVKGYVFNRTLKGIQALMDEIGATGSKEVKQTTSVNRQFKILDYKTLKIKADVDGISTEVADLAENTASQFTQTAEQIATKVSKDGVISEINQSAEEIKIQALKLALEGLITLNGKTKILEDGSFEGTDAKFSGDITGSAISGTSFTQTGEQGTVDIIDGGINADYANIKSMSILELLLIGLEISFNASTGVATIKTVNATNLNGTNSEIGALTVTTIGTGLSNGSPIHSGNIAQQSVNYATTSGSANSASVAMAGYNGASGSFTTANGKTVTVTNGIITSIV